jgi:hypothetical protein
VGATGAMASHTQPTSPLRSPRFLILAVRTPYATRRNVRRSSSVKPPAMP